MVPIALILGGALLYRVGSRRRPAPSQRVAFDRPNKSDCGSGSHVQTQQTTAEQKRARHTFQVSNVSLATASVGSLLFHPFAVLSALGVSYNLMNLYRDGFRSVTQERKVNVAVVDSAAVTLLLLNRFYFFAAFTDWIFYGGQYLVTKVKDKSLTELVNTFGTLPNKVFVLRQGIETEVAISSLRKGDVVMVAAGEIIAVDGVVKEGIALVDQHALTGEAQPVEVVEGDRIYASTTVLSGKILIATTESGADTAVGNIAKLLRETAGHKTELEERGEKIANGLALPTLGLSLAAWPVVGVGGSLAVLYSYIGDGMRIIAPLSTLNHLRIASQHSLLIKEAQALEQLFEVDTLVFDKTGTLTMEQPEVTNIHLFGDWKAERILALAAAAEGRQNHPIARAIVEEANHRGLDISPFDTSQYRPGFGITVTHEHKVIRLGSLRFLESEQIEVGDPARHRQQEAHRQGNSIVFLAIDTALAGAIELGTQARPEARVVVDALRRRGLDLYIISGDHLLPTERLAQQLGIDRYFAETLPQNKYLLVKELQQAGKKVCFVGDGINDSVAMKQADVSVSLSGASAVAVDMAQVVLMDQTLTRLPLLFDLSDRLASNQKASFVSTMVPGGITIGGAFLLGFGVASASLLYVGGLAAGIGIALYPRFREQWTRRDFAPDSAPPDPLSPPEKRVESQPIPRRTTPDTGVDAPIPSDSIEEPPKPLINEYRRPIIKAWREVWVKRTKPNGDSTLETLLNFGGFGSSHISIDSDEWLRYCNQIRWQLALDEDHSIYEVGCGAGAFLYPFAQTGREVGGCDFSETMLNLARESIPNGKFDLHDASRLNGKMHDAVVSNAVFNYFPDLQYAAEVVEKMVRKSRHTLLITDINHQQYQKAILAARCGALSVEEYLQRFQKTPFAFYTPEWFLSLSEDLGVSCSVLPQHLNHHYRDYRFNIMMRI